MTQQPDPAARPVVVVLSGATGDLARRMVLPAVYRLACGGLLPRQWLVVGNGRGDITHESFRARVRDALTESGPQARGNGLGLIRAAGVLRRRRLQPRQPGPPAGRARPG